MDDMWDVVIIGGGPAGCAAALRARQLRPRARILATAARPNHVVPRRVFDARLVDAARARRRRRPVRRHAEGRLARVRVVVPDR
ncbi:choline dehydrogenase-like flavoprotein [Streptosporangium album]|uniref:Choline dehydrogenase-like flavoprotein n=1 Tax=Streptosporangium album TaxID=47479 RepID=A0A7W7WDC3_9ACTN|nr:FAD-dependent oxidoreductase [Streptosporangium album]MBB4943557.1 choline dehydrogenase-like flavoprotein [Streptosporangium album]